MVKKNNKKCILCGKTYTYCSRCEEFDHLPRWMEIYCSDNCKKIFNILTDYNAKILPAKEAAKRLKDCDISNVGNFHEFNQKLIAEIQEADPAIADVVTLAEVSDEESKENDENTETETRKPIRVRKRK